MKRWLSVTVELLGGRGERFWPPPGRVLVVGPRHTFADLRDAVNQAFGRWDLSHLSTFTLADGSILGDEEETEGLDVATTRVVDAVGPGTSFRFVFDLGDSWVHACTVAEEYVEPVEVLGLTPDAPTPHFGWGDLPDQYGRRWRDESDEAAPDIAHPMLRDTWPAPVSPPVDVREVGGATHARDPARILAAVQDHDVSAALQQVGIALQVTLESAAPLAAALVPEVADLLDKRGWEGDSELVQDLRALLAGQPLAGKTLPVPLLELADQLDGPPGEGPGYLDLETGEVLPWVLTDAGMVGEDAAVDVEDDPDRWLALDDRLGSREGWRDMAAFAATVPGDRLRAQLEVAIEGRGAFRRFRDVVHNEGLALAWQTFSNERQMGRARTFLADNGIRPVP